jgi:hypothetical protein
MRGPVQRHGMLLVSFVAVAALSGVSDAYAQKKLTYEQAWAKCRADVVASTPGEGASSTARYARGMSCMKQYGYKLKKSAKFE